MLQNIINYQSFENTQENVHGEVYSSKVAQQTDCNFAIRKLYRGFFVEYDPKVALLKRILWKNVYRVPVF